MQHSHPSNCAPQKLPTNNLMQHETSCRNLVVSLFGILFLSAIQPIAAVEATRVSVSPVAPSAVTSKPCPTCVEAIGLDAFRQSIRGEIIPVIVELSDPPGVMSKM